MTCLLDSFFPALTCFRECWRLGSFADVYFFHVGGCVFMFCGCFFTLGGSFFVLVTLFIALLRFFCALLEMVLCFLCFLRALPF